MKGYIKVRPAEHKSEAGSITITSWCENYTSHATVPATNNRLIRAIKKDQERILFAHMRCDEVETDDKRLVD